MILGIGGQAMWLSWWCFQWIQPVIIEESSSYWALKGAGVDIKGRTRWIEGCGRSLPEAHTHMINTYSLQVQLDVVKPSPLPH